MHHLLLLTENNIVKENMTKLEKRNRLLIFETSLEYLESKVKLNLNNLEKRIERNVSRHSLKSKQLRSFNKRCML
jgi:hypothetical protein